MDPFTIISGATVAFNTIKKGIELGKGLHDMPNQLSQWAGAMSDLGRAEAKAKNPPWWRAISGDVEQEAMQIFSAKKKAEQMRSELRSYISFSMGPSAWDELVRTEAQVRKRKQEQEYRQEEIKEAIITWSLGIVAFILAVGLLTTCIYFIGAQQGKW